VDLQRETSRWISKPEAEIENLSPHMRKKNKIETKREHTHLFFSQVTGMKATTTSRHGVGVDGVSWLWLALGTLFETEEENEKKQHKVQKEKKGGKLVFLKGNFQSSPIIRDQRVRLKESTKEALHLNFWREPPSTTTLSQR